MNFIQLMADGAIGQNGVNAQFHAEELITPELGFVITLLQLMVVLTVSEMHLKLEDATKILVQVSNQRVSRISSKILTL